MTDDWPHPSAMCTCKDRFDKHAYDEWGKELICTAITRSYGWSEKHKLVTAELPCRCKGFRPKERAR